LVELILYELSFAMAIIFYLYMFYYQDNWAIGLIGFLLPVALGFIFNDIEFRWGLISSRQKNKVLALLITIALSIALFITLGLLFDAWIWAWQLFLLIPVSSIVLWNKKFQLTPIMPFIAVVLFFSIGHFFGLFHISWLAFLLIPIVAVIENA